MNFFKKIAKLLGFNSELKEEVTPIQESKIIEETIQESPKTTVEDVVDTKAVENTVKKKSKKYRPRKPKPKAESVPTEEVKKPKKPYRRKPKPKKPTE